MSTRRRTFPWHGWIGIAWLITCEALLLFGNHLVATWFTPLMWTGYILTADAAVAGRSGASWLTTRRKEVPLLLLLSVGVWLMFEAYNFHLKNWFYANVPANAWVRGIAFFWSFATIMPSVFETADLVRTFLPSRTTRPLPAAPRASRLAVSFAIGVALVTLPLAAPQSTAAYLFGAVWIGFILLLHPVLERLGIGGAIWDWHQGEWQTAIALLSGGFVCGLLWEAWNYQAVQHDGAYWIYTIPEALRVFGIHYGKMPILGLVGFPPFALELHAFYLVLKALLGGTRTFGGPQTGQLTTSSPGLPHKRLPALLDIDASRSSRQDSRVDAGPYRFFTARSVTSFRGTRRTQAACCHTCVDLIRADAQAPGPGTPLDASVQSPTRRG